MAELTLRWEKFGLSRGLHDMLGAGELVDVTLACQGEFLQAHKSVLAACSQQFRHIFLMNPCQHPVVFMQDVQLPHLQALLSFMYTGETCVQQSALPGFMRTAQALQISGLSDASTSQQAQEWIDPMAPGVDSPLHSYVKRQRVQSQQPQQPQQQSSSSGLCLSPPLSAAELNSGSSSCEAVDASPPPSQHGSGIPPCKIQSVSSIKLEAEEVSLDTVSWSSPPPSQPPQQFHSSPSGGVNNSHGAATLVPVTVDGQTYVPRRHCALLDGKFFSIVRDNKDGLWAQCQLCLPLNKVIKGNWETTSNFKTHLSRMHAGAVQQYEQYKQSWVRPLVCRSYARRSSTNLPSPSPLASPSAVPSAMMEASPSPGLTMSPISVAPMDQQQPSSSA